MEAGGVHLVKRCSYSRCVSLYDGLSPMPTATAVSSNIAISTLNRKSCPLKALLPFLDPLRPDRFSVTYSIESSELIRRKTDSTRNTFISLFR